MLIMVGLFFFYFLCYVIMEKKYFKVVGLDFMLEDSDGMELYIVMWKEKFFVVGYIFLLVIVLFIVYVSEYVII